MYHFTHVLGEFSGLSTGWLLPGLHIPEYIACLQGIGDDQTFGGITCRINGEPLLLWNTGDPYPDNAHDLFDYDENTSTTGDSNVSLYQSINF